MRYAVMTAGLAALMVFESAGASAADLPIRSVPPIAPLILPSWTGFHVGVQGGYRFDEANGKGTLFELAYGTVRADRRFDLDTPVGGPRVGYDLQIGPSFVVGLLGDVSWGDGRRTASESLLGAVTPPPQTATAALAVAPSAILATGTLSVRHQWDATVRVRAGYLFTPTLLGYVTGGLALLDERVTASYTVSGLFGTAYTASNTRTGWTVGAGVETKLFDRWRAHVEYRYADFGSQSYSWAAEGSKGKLRTSTNTVLAGVSYAF